MRSILVFTFIIAFTLGAYGQKARQAEDFTALNMSGDTVELSSLRGKVVLLTFWSTRCPICHSEIPKLNRMSAGYSSADIVFLAATMENEAKVEAYTKHNPFTFDILPNSFGLLLKYADRDREGNLDMGFPAYFLIDRTGAIQYRASGWDKIAKLNTSIDTLLARR